MKANLRSFVFILYTVVGGMGLLAGNAQSADEAMPPEVKALIGMKIPAKAGDAVSGWKVMGAGLFEAKASKGQKFGYELLYQQNISIIVIDIMDVDHDRTITDALVLPRQLLNYEIADGKPVFKKNGRQLYNVEPSCRRGQFEVVVGMMRPEKGKESCQHWTTRVKLAWLIDQRTGQLSEISPHGVYCFYDAEGGC